MSRLKKRGFTLAEMMVTLVVFALFSSTLLGILTLALRYMSRTDRLFAAQKNASTALECMASELKTAVINSSSTGYLSISPAALNPTAVLVPSSLSAASAELSFTAVNPTNRDQTLSSYLAVCDPSSSSYDSSDAANYQTVRYYVDAAEKEMHREVKKYDSSGNVVSTGDDLIAQTSEGSISFIATLSQSDLVNIQITCSEGESSGVETFTAKCDVYISSSN